MDNTLELTFKDTLEREGLDISIGATKHRVFFRRNDDAKAETTPYNTLYALYTDNIEQGVTFTLNGSKWLVIKAIQDENTVYKKYSCLRCNATIKMQYGKNDLVIYDVYMNDLANSLNNNKYGITISSKAEFIISLDAESKRLDNNQRFYCGAYIQPWKITDINYLNGLCYVYADRDSVLANDDTENGIADRWQYEHRPDTYKIVLSDKDIDIDYGEVKTITYSVYKNGELVENPIVYDSYIEDILITDDMNVDDEEITKKYYLTLSADNRNVDYTIVDSSTINIMGVEVGTSKITASYKMQDNDVAITDSVAITIKEPPLVVGDIIVTPVYTNDTYYKLKQGRTQTFTCSIDGLESPQWNITLDSSGNDNTNNVFTSKIDNGTFTVTNSKYSSTKNVLVYRIQEQTTEKSLDYTIKLTGML